MPKPPIAVGGTELAEWLDLEPQSVSRLAKQGVLPKEARGRYNLQQCVTAYVQYAKALASNKKGAEPEDLQEIRKQKEKADLRLTEARAQQEELKAQELQRQLVPMRDVIEVVTTLVKTAQSKLLAIPTRLAAQARQTPSNAEAKALIETAIREALSEVSQDRLYFKLNYDSADESGIEEPCT